MTIKSTLLALLLALSSHAVFAQYDNDEPKDTSKTSKQHFLGLPDDFKKELYGGMNYGVPIFTFTPVDLNIYAAYRIKPYLHVGAGPNFMYRVSDQVNRPFSQFGGSAFARLFMGNIIYLHAELAALNVATGISNQTMALERQWVGGLLIGGGYKQRVFGNGFSYLTILYDPRYTSPGYPLISPYGSPLLLRAGIAF